MKSYKISIAIFLGVFVLSCGPKITHSGFLNDYSDLKESEANATMLSYISPKFERGKYTKLMIGNITMNLHKESKSVNIDVDKLKELSDFFKAAIIKNLEMDYALVDQPGDDVALIQIAITDIKPGKLFSNIFPISVAVNTATGRGKGGASLEMKVVDSQTKEILGKAVDNRKNKGYIATFSKFGNARAVMSYWAKLLKERVDWFKTNQ